MSGGQARVNERAAQLREAFDRSFAESPRTGVVAVHDLLAIRVGTHRYVVRLAELSGLTADKKVTRVPSPMPALRGIASFKGTVLPVYDLGMLLGRQQAAAPRWIFVTAVTPVALAFEGFDGYLRVPAEDIVSQERAEAHVRHVREVVQAGGLAQPLISLASVLESIRSLP